MPEILNLHKIKTIDDLHQIKIGMFIYKDLNNELIENIDLTYGNYIALKVEEIGEDHVVLVSNDNAMFNSLPIAKEFDRLIQDDQWWYEVK